MLQKVFVLALCGLVALSAAMPFDVLADDISDCKLCEHIVGAAERHHHNNLGNTTQDQLKRELDRECFQFTHTHGDGAAKKCADFVNAHIATIYNDIKAGKRPPAVCRDLGLCGGTGAPPTGMPMTTMASGPKVELAPEILAPHDPCRTCAFIVGRAEHHFKPNETSDQLKGHLENECKQLAHLQGQQAADHCKQIIDNNIQTIYNDIKAGKRPHQICTDIGECGGATGMPPTGMPASGAPKANVLAPEDPCRTCAFIIGRAEHRFKPDETADQLKGHLENECKQLAHLQGQQAADHCTQMVDTNIQTIYNDIKAGKRPHQICTDIGECNAGTGMPPTGMPASGAPKADILARPHDPCRTCEFIIGRAEFHIHNGNVPDEKRLLRELEHECIQLAHTEGDQASVACLNIIQKDIDMIYNDIKAGKRPRQICEDMGECHARTGMPTGVPMTTGGPVMASTPPPSLIKKFLNIFH